MVWSPVGTSDSSALNRRKDDCNGGTPEPGRGGGGGREPPQGNSPEALRIPLHVGDGGLPREGPQVPFGERLHPRQAAVRQRVMGCGEDTLPPAPPRGGVRCPL